MNNLSENFKYLDRLQGRLNKVRTEKEQFEEEHKSDEVLKQYIKMLLKEQQLEDNIKECKDILYNDMCDSDIDMLNGNHIDVTLKRPYFKTEVLTKKFLKDNKEGSKLYEKYVTRKSIKGNINIKVL